VSLTDIPALGHEYSKDEEEEEEAGASPSVWQVWDGLVKVCLVHLHIAVLALPSPCVGDSPTHASKFRRLRRDGRKGGVRWLWCVHDGEEVEVLGEGAALMEGDFF
jgi:hypothetical protein